MLSSEEVASGHWRAFSLLSPEMLPVSKPGRRLRSRAELLTVMGVEVGQRNDVPAGKHRKRRHKTARSRTASEEDREDSGLQIRYFLREFVSSLGCEQWECNSGNQTLFSISYTETCSTPTLFMNAFGTEQIVYLLERREMLGPASKLAGDEKRDCLQEQ